MLKVGLTGSIGSGKSTASLFFKSLGVPIIDADVISREVLEIYPSIKNEIRHKFSKEFFDEDENLKRRELGKFIFNDKSKRLEYEGIILPYIKKEIFSAFNEFQNKSSMCILDAPTLIESGFYKYVHKVLLVSASQKIRISRVMARDKISEEDVLKRIKSQMDDGEKEKYADYIVYNEGNLEYLYNDLNKIYNELIDLGKRHETQT